VIVIALIAIYLARHREGQPGDLKGLRDRVAPGIVELEDTAKRLAHAASGQAEPSPSPKATSSRPDAATPNAISPVKNIRSPRAAAHRSKKSSTR
jgi:hypothetical protein